jgi:hypothetical protein
MEEYMEKNNKTTNNPFNISESSFLNRVPKSKEELEQESSALGFGSLLEESAYSNVMQRITFNPIIYKNLGKDEQFRIRSAKTKNEQLEYIRIYGLEDLLGEYLKMSPIEMLEANMEFLEGARDELQNLAEEKERQFKETVENYKKNHK